MAPLQAPPRLTADGVDVLHTIRRDDTQHHRRGYGGFLAGKTTRSPWSGCQDHRQRRDPDASSLGAWTRGAGAKFARTSSVSTTPVIGKGGSWTRVMGRHCGWLTAATAQAYRGWLDTRVAAADRSQPGGLGGDGVYLPEAVLTSRRSPRPQGGDGSGGLGQLFLSEGAGWTRS